MPKEISAADVTRVIREVADAQAITDFGKEMTTIFLETFGPDDLDRLLDAVDLVGTPTIRVWSKNWRAMAEEAGILRRI